MLGENNIALFVGITANGDVPTKEQTSAEAFSMDGSDWVELFVREMLNASNIDDARARASRALEVFEKSILACAGAEVAQNFHQIGAYHGCYSCNWLYNIGIELYKLLLLLFVGKYDAERTTGNTNSGKYYSQASCFCSTWAPEKIWKSKSRITTAEASNISISGAVENPWGLASYTGSIYAYYVAQLSVCVGYEYVLDTSMLNFSSLRKVISLGLMYYLGFELASVPTMGFELFFCPS